MMHLSIPRALNCLSVLGLIIQSSIAEAQSCPGGAPLLSMTYTTTKVGNSNNTYTLSQFDPSIGTLYSADLKAVRYFTYNFTLTNSNSVPENYKVNVLRDDSMYAYSPSNPTPLAIYGMSFFRQHIYSGATAVPPGVTTYDVPEIYPGTVSQTFNQSVVPFLGSDSLYIIYKTTNEALTTVSNPNVTISNNTGYDSILFTIKYNYCPTNTLASTLLTLTSRLQDANVVLSWTSEDRYSDGYYEILKSTDGRSYSSINKQAINKNQLNSYNYLYKPLATDGSTGFFRIKQTNSNGDIIYSRIVTVILPQNTNTFAPAASETNKLTVYPTVTKNFVNLALPEGNANDEWQVSIVSLSGQVLQNSAFKGNGQVKVLLNNSMPAGMHIVSALNKRTNISYKGKIIVQN